MPFKENLITAKVVTAIFRGTIFLASLSASLLHAVTPSRGNFADLDAFLFKPWKSLSDRPALDTDGILILKNGQVLHERYRSENGYSAENPHIGWSMSKSVLNILVGITVHEGRISLDDSIDKFITTNGLARVTIRNLLEMRSCIQWQESYEEGGLLASSVLSMLYGKGQSDMPAFVASHPLSCEPGSRWQYSSGNSLLLTAALRKVWGEEWTEMPWNKFFEPLGISSATWERDASGTIVGSSYLYATQRDFARIGEFFLADGVWKGKRIVPEGWVSYSIRNHLLEDKTEAGALRWGYGAHWWTLGEKVVAHINGLGFKIPADAYLAWGHWGQVLIIIPSESLIIVRTGTDRGGHLNPAELVIRTMKALDPETPGDPSKIPDIADSSPKEEKEVTREISPLGLPGISTSFVAKEHCSCRFVENRPAAVCDEYTKQSPDLAKLWVNLPQMTTETGFFLIPFRSLTPYRREAKWHSKRNGCGLSRG